MHKKTLVELFVLPFRIITQIVNHTNAFYNQMLI